MIASNVKKKNQKNELVRSKDQIQPYIRDHINHIWRLDSVETNLQTDSEKESPHKDSLVI